MVDLNYKQIMHILNALDEKISRLEEERDEDLKRKRSIESTRAALPVFNRSDEEKTEEEPKEERSRFDELIKEHRDTKNSIASELGRLKFPFGVEEKSWNQKQTNSQ